MNVFFSSAIAQTDSLGFSRTMSNGIGDFWNFLSRFWSFGLFEIKGQPVQISQVIIALFFLSVGVFVSRWLTHRLRRYLLSHSHVDKSAIVLLESITFYTLIIIIVLSTLQMIQIPVAMFAFLGGAIAIGLGFGAQNIFNNFISGLILMIERPVRIGDLIEVDSKLGRVLDIGARSTSIKRVDGAEILMPNSTLLESNVTNLTLSDNRYRTKVGVGVAYGSDVQKVSDILSEILHDHSKILAKPASEVFFSDFGDNALIFKVLFWVEVVQMIELRKIESEVRFEMERRFRENAIVIAFPQRDLHFDGQTPLNVRVLKSGD